MSTNKKDKGETKNNNNNSSNNSSKNNNTEGEENVEGLDDLESALNDIEKALDNLESQNGSIFTRLKELDESNRVVRKELAEAIQQKGKEEEKSTNEANSNKAAESN